MCALKRQLGPAQRWDLQMLHDVHKKSVHMTQPPLQVLNPMACQHLLLRSNTPQRGDFQSKVSELNLLPFKEALQKL